MKTGHEVYVVEARNPDGTLNLKGEQPPFITATEDELFDLYFKHNPDGASSVSLETIAKWYRSKGWVYRVKTW